MKSGTFMVLYIIIVIEQGLQKNSIKSGSGVETVILTNTHTHIFYARPHQLLAYSARGLFNYKSWQ